MSEFWVSKKKYYCKYCEIYIADDAPSRNHHESGMRHKGNLERFIRGIYKTGEKRKKDLEEEKREMARVEQLANAAFADDIGAGRAAPVAGPSKPAARRPAATVDSSSPWSNYSTAESLGFTDPDAERLAKEAEVRRSQGVAGEWEVVSVTPTPAPEIQPDEEETKPDVATTGEKRPAEVAGVDDEDTRSYKLRKKTLNPGGLLGDIYDPGLLSIKVKKKEEPVKQEEVVPKLENPASELPPPSWKPLQLKLAKDVADGAQAPQATNAPTPSSSASKWVKSGWGVAEPSPPMPPPPAPTAPTEPMTDAAPAPSVKEEESDVKSSASQLQSAEATSAPMFKKRRAPASSARGRRPI